MRFDVKVCMIAQHREVLGQMLEPFEVSPENDLDIMKQRQSLFEVTSNIVQ